MLKSRVIAFIDDVDCWLACNRLKLNPAKSEFLWTATARRLPLVDNNIFHFGDCEVTPSTMYSVQLWHISLLQLLHGSTYQQTCPTVRAWFYQLHR